MDKTSKKRLYKFELYVDGKKQDKAREDVLKRFWEPLTYIFKTIKTMGKLDLY